MWNWLENTLGTEKGVFLGKSFKKLAHSFFSLYISAEFNANSFMNGESMKKLAMVIFLASMVGSAYAQAPAAPAPQPAAAPAPAAQPAAAPAAAAPAPAPAAQPAAQPAAAPAAPAAPVAEAAPAAEPVAEAPAVDPCAVDTLGQYVDPEGCAAAMEAARQQAIADSIAAEEARQKAIADSIAAEQARADSIAAAEEAARQQAIADSIAAAEAARKQAEADSVAKANAPRFAVGLTVSGGFGMFDVQYDENHFKDFPFTFGVSGLFSKGQFGARLAGSMQYHRLYVGESRNRTVNEGYWRAGAGLYGRWMPSMKEGLIVELGITGAWVTSDDIVLQPHTTRMARVTYKPQSEYDIELGAGYGITFAGMAGEIGAFVSYDLNETMEFTSDVDGSAWHIGARASFWILNL